MTRKINCRTAGNATVPGYLGRVILISAVTVFGMGCQPDDNGRISEPAEGNSQDASGDSKNSIGDVDLELADWSQIEKAIADQPGKIVVVDFWSTSCFPCKKEFPNLVELQNRFKEDVVCFAVNVDYIGLPKKSPDSYESRVMEFLTKQNPSFKCFLSTTADTDLFPKAGVTLLPTVQVYDADGLLAATIDGSKTSGDSFSYKADVLPLVESLVRGLEYRNSEIDNADKGNPVSDEQET